MPQTPVARLDAVKTRLQAMVDAMNTVRPKLHAFYASLGDEQKARFNTMGPPPRSASAQQAEQKGKRGFGKKRGWMAGVKTPAP